LHALAGMSHTTSGSQHRPARPLTGQGLTFNLADELRALRNDVGWTSGQRASKTLGKAGGLRAVLVVLRAGVTLEPQAAAGESTVQVLAGSLRMSAGGQDVQANAGELVLMSENLREPIQAVDDAAFLLTIAWPEGAGADDQAEVGGR
jgi:quercetin dioxygenase-like cupin family protein